MGARHVALPLSQRRLMTITASHRHPTTSFLSIFQPQRTTITFIMAANTLGATRSLVRSVARSSARVSAAAAPTAIAARGLKSSSSARVTQGLAGDKGECEVWSRRKTRRSDKGDQIRSSRLTIPARHSQPRLAIPSLGWLQPDGQVRPHSRPAARLRFIHCVM